MLWLIQFVSTIAQDDFHFREAILQKNIFQGGVILTFKLENWKWFVYVADDLAINMVSLSNWNDWSKTIDGSFCFCHMVVGVLGPFRDSIFSQKCKTVIIIFVESCTVNEHAERNRTYVNTSGAFSGYILTSDWNMIFFLNFISCLYFWYGWPGLPPNMFLPPELGRTIVGEPAWLQEFSCDLSPASLLRLERRTGPMWRSSLSLSQLRVKREEVNLFWLLRIRNDLRWHLRLVML